MCLCEPLSFRDSSNVSFWSPWKQRGFCGCHGEDMKFCSLQLMACSVALDCEPLICFYFDIM